MFAEQLFHLPYRELLLKQRAVERDVHRHAAGEIADIRREDGRMRERAHLLHFGKVLVMKPQRIEAGRVERTVSLFRLVLGDALLARARVAADRVADEGIVLRRDAVRDQRIDEGDKAARITAGIGDALGALDGLSVKRRELGEAVCPALRRAVRRGSVDDDCLRPFRKLRRFLCRVVGQAQEDGIRRVDGFFAGGRVLAVLLIEGDKLHIAPLLHALDDLQPRRARAAVDEYLDHFPSFLSSMALTLRGRPKRLMKPSESFWEYAPPSSSKVAMSSLYSE